MTDFSTALHFSAVFSNIERAYLRNKCLRKDFVKEKSIKFYLTRMTTLFGKNFRIFQTWLTCAEASKVSCVGNNN